MAAPAKGTLTVDALFSHALGNLDLELYNSSHILLSSATSLTDNERVTATVLGDGIYYIRVLGASGALQSAYTLDIDGPEQLILADALEPNNTFALPADLGSGDQTREDLTIHQSGNDDWFKWTPSANGMLTVETLFRHEYGDVNLQLYDAAQNVIAESTSTDDDEQFTAAVVAGQKYVIRVYGADGSVQRSYDLVIDGPEILPDALEPNEAFAQAHDLGTRDQTHEGLTIHAPGNDDWYLWRASRSGTLDVEIRFSNSLGDLDLGLFDSSQNLLEEATGFRDVEHISWEVSQGNTYAIHVYRSGFGSGVQPDYDLVINGPGPDQDVFEPNDTRETAADLGSGDQAHKSLTIHEPQNNDWYRWTAPVAGTLLVDITFDHALGDLNLEAYGASGNLLAASTSTTSDEQISLQVAAGQAYSIRVFGVGDAIHPNYSMIVNGPGPAGPVRTQR